MGGRLQKQGGGSQGCRFQAACGKGTVVQKRRPTQRGCGSVQGPGAVEATDRCCRIRAAACRCPAGQDLRSLCNGARWLGELRHGDFCARLLRCLVR